MRIRLRPYHPTFVVAYFGMGGKTEGYNKDGFNDIINKIRRNHDIKVELVEEHDDICKKCDKLVENEKGSIWGKRHTCSSAQDESIVNEVNEVNELVFRATGLQFGSVVKMRELVKLLQKNIPILDNIKQGTKYQESYEKGLTLLSQMLKTVD
jgi:hypothetical protein